MRRGLIVPLAVAMVAWALPGAAQAGPRIAFLGFAVEGVSDDVRQQFETVIEEGLRKGGAELVTRHDALDLITSRELPEGCAFGPCVAAVSKALSVERILDARIAADGQSYSFVLSMIEGRAGTPVAQVVGSCAVCTVAEALTKVGGAIEVLEGRAPTGQPSDLVARRVAPRKASRVPPLLVAAAGLVAGGGGALLVSQTEHDNAGWVTIGAGGTVLLTGLIWLLVGD